MTTRSRASIDPTAEEFDLPWWQQIPVRVIALVLEIITRIVDLGVLLLRPKLWVAYLGSWWAELRHSPYRWPRGFEVTRLLKASGQLKRELVYGETPLFTGLWLLHRAHAGRDSLVLDIGAGRGRFLLSARWLGAGARGFELLPMHIKPVAALLAAVGAEIIQADATQADPSWATHVYLNWCGFTAETKDRLVENLLRCAEGTRFIAVTRPVKHADFVQVSTHWALYTWGLERVWIQELRKTTQPHASP